MDQEEGRSDVSEWQYLYMQNLECQFTTTNLQKQTVDVQDKMLHIYKLANSQTLSEALNQMIDDNHHACQLKKWSSLLPLQSIPEIQTWCTLKTRILSFQKLFYISATVSLKFQLQWRTQQMAERSIHLFGSKIHKRCSLYESMCAEVQEISENSNLS